MKQKHLLFTLVVFSLQMIDKATAKEKLVVHVPEVKVTFSVFMETGTLVIQVKKRLKLNVYSMSYLHMVYFLPL